MFAMPFAAEFHKMAVKETQVFQKVTIANQFYEELAFINMYCDQEDCDCRRATIFVDDLCGKFTIPLAVISYGWEPLSFYKKWGPLMDNRTLKNFKGPAIDWGHQQSNPHPDFVALFKKQLQDENFKQLFPQQYARYKNRIGMPLPSDIEADLGLDLPCSCESGKIFGNCCNRKRNFWGRLIDKFLP